MRRFAALYGRLDAARSGGVHGALASAGSAATPDPTIEAAGPGELEALTTWLQQSEPGDASWGLQLLLGRQRRRWISGQRLRQIAALLLRLPAWLIDDCVRQAGDSAEALALLWPDSDEPDTAPAADQGLQHWMEVLIPATSALQGDAQTEAVADLWSSLRAPERLVLNKLLSGSLCSGRWRGGLETGLLSQALAAMGNLDTQLVLQRLQAEPPGRQLPPPTAEQFLALLRPAEPQERVAPLPLPWEQEQPLAEGRRPAGPCSAWQLDWNWDGLRVQLIRSEGCTDLVSQEGTRLEMALPGLLPAAAELPEQLVIDGVLLLWPDGQGRPAPLQALLLQLHRGTPRQREGGRQLPTPAQLVLIARDLLQCDGQDLRPWALEQRQQALRQLLLRLGMPDHAGPEGARLSWLRLPDALPLKDWSDLEPWQARGRTMGARGLLLRQRTAAYGPPPWHEPCLSLPLQPFHVPAVLLYVQSGHGRETSSLYTFGLWDAAPAAGGQLVTFCRTDVGLDADERQELARWTRQHTRQRHGPVRAVEPVQVFEIAFHGVERSGRHRSGLAVQQPRIQRWLRDQPPEMASTLEVVRGVLNS